MSSLTDRIAELQAKELEVQGEIARVRSEIGRIKCLAGLGEFIGQLVNVEKLDWSEAYKAQVIEYLKILFESVRAADKLVESYNGAIPCCERADDGELANWRENLKNLVAGLGSAMNS